MDGFVRVVGTWAQVSFLYLGVVLLYYFVFCTIMAGFGIDYFIYLFLYLCTEDDTAPICFCPPYRPATGILRDHH